MEEVFYRRCCPGEADAIASKQGLTNGQAKFKQHNCTARSEPYKWLTTSSRFAREYMPEGVDETSYSKVAMFHMAEGTYGALQMEREEGRVKRGPRGAYGIPFDLIPWFNNRVLDLHVYDMDTDTIPKAEQSTSVNLLRGEDGRYATFLAFSAEYISPEGFTDRMNQWRMTWVKTSLPWMLWRADWGRKENMERIVRVDIPESYLFSLVREGEPTKLAKPTDDVIFQLDPDRRIIGRRWQEGNSYWVNGGRTVHFGLRRQALNDFIDIIAWENLSDITDTVQAVERERSEHPRQELHERLGVEQVEFSVPVKRWPS